MTPGRGSLGYFGCLVRLLDTQRGGKKRKGFLDVLLRFRAETGGESLLQEGLRRVELLVGSYLLLLDFAIAAQRNAENFAGDFDLLHRANAVAVVVVVRRREGGI